MRAWRHALRYTAEMIVSSGDFVATSGIYRLVGVLGDSQEYTLVYGDAVPEHRGERCRFKLWRAAPHPVRG
jgi:hypothetical protein